MLLICLETNKKLFNAKIMKFWIKMRENILSKLNKIYFRPLKGTIVENLSHSQLYGTVVSRTCFFNFKCCEQSIKSSIINDYSSSLCIKSGQRFIKEKFVLSFYILIVRISGPLYILIILIKVYIIWVEGIRIVIKVSILKVGEIKVVIKISKLKVGGRGDKDCVHITLIL